MVVCKCRKATRLYCFVHKVPVCGECMCFPEHQICVVKKYSDWVVDGEYDWPPICSLCNAALEDGNDQTTRLGCLHLMHTQCLITHIKSFSPQTAPAGYVCPACSSPIWPPSSIKDTGSLLHTKLKEAIILSGLEKNVFGSHLVSPPASEKRIPPPAFASDPLKQLSIVEETDGGGSAVSLVSTDDKYSDKAYKSTVGVGSMFTQPEIIEIDGPNALEGQFLQDQEPHLVKTPGATTRKPTYYDRKNSDTSYYADDEDGTNKKYTRRGPFHLKFLRMLLPFWSSQLPSLPVSVPARKESNANGTPEGKIRHQKSSRMDPRKILLIMAIMACMTTMGILYYRLAQRSLDENMPEDEPQ